MIRVALVALPPLSVQGLAAALPQAEMSVQTYASMAGAAGADVIVCGALDGLPPGAAAVLIGAAQPPPHAGPVATLSPLATPAQVRAAIIAVHHGLFASDRPQAPSMARNAALDEAHEPLTAREIEVFELLAKGLSNRDIGAVLGISSHTAKFHVGQILVKTAAATRAEAVHAGLRLGLIGI